MTTSSVGEIRSATATGGASLTTTADAIGLPEGTRMISMTARNFATGVVCRWSANPYLLILRRRGTFTSGNMTDYSSESQDADTATSVTLSSQNTEGNNNFLYVGSHLPFRGVDIDVDSTNGTSSTLTVDYWNGSAWADISDTDGTSSGGASLAQDGQVTWSVPSGWTADSLVDIGDASSAVSVHVGTQDIYWTRWTFSAQLDSSVTLDHMLSLNRSTSYSELLVGQAFEMGVTMGPGGYGCIEALMNAGTGNLVVNVATASTTSRFA